MTIQNHLWYRWGIQVAQPAHIVTQAVVTNMMAALLCVLFFTHATVYGQYASKFPAPIPLFHKSPYFNAWLPTNDSIYTQGDYPLIMPGKYVHLHFPLSPSQFHGSWVSSSSIGWLLSVSIAQRTCCKVKHTCCKVNPNQNMLLLKRLEHTSHLPALFWSWMRVLWEWI